MAEPDININIEEGYKTILIGIDRDKNSQAAVKWAVDNLVKGKVVPVVLIHVKVQTRDDSSVKNGRTPSENELQELFLHYRGFCARKGIDAKELILHDTDITSALVRYIKTNSVGTIVVGASTRNVLLRRFKQPDVPTSLGKFAPDFTAIYVISKGKIQSMRPATNRITPPKIEKKLDNSNSMCNKSYWTSNTSGRSSFNSTVSTSGRGSAISSKHESPRNASTDTPRSQGSSVFRTPRYPASPGHPGSGFNPDQDDIISNSGVTVSSVSSDTPSSQGSLPPLPFSISTVSTDDSSRNYSAQSWRSEESDVMSVDRNSIAESDVIQSPLIPFRKMKTNLGKPISYGSNITSSSYGSSISSLGSASSMITDNDEVGVQIKRLRLEITSVVDLYETISQQAISTKQRAEDLLSKNSDGELTLEDVTLAKEAALAVADLERLKAKAAVDAARMSERLAELEARQREIAEQKAKQEEEEKNKRGIVLSKNANLCYSYRVYDYDEIRQATNSFSPSLKVGEGAYGPVYKATLHHTPVAIKVLESDVAQGIKQFQQEIDVLGRIRHPHMVLLLGACPEHSCLVYEYMERGSLEDRLFCKNNTPPIPWQARFKIASEVATALHFLHETKPEPMVHRDLKPANILLDSNYTSKIADVGLARLVPASAANTKTQYHMTAAAGTFCYIDPEYQQTGMLGTKSDIYSFGVVLLQLLTARPAMALAYHVEKAIECGTFGDILDPNVTDWPVEQALILGQMALKCCELRKRDRPELATEMLPELIRLREFAVSS